VRRNARSAATSTEVAASFNTAQAFASSSSFLRICNPSAPWPTAGSIVSTGRNCVIFSVSPFLFIPAAAKITPLIFSVSIFLILVSILPLSGTILTSGSNALICAPRRCDPVPIFAPFGMNSNLMLFRETRTSRTSSRGRIAENINPSGFSPGTSFMLCTARSIFSESRASSISLTKTPWPPMVRSDTSCIMSPLVLMTQISTSASGMAFFNLSATKFVCVNASLLPRVPILIFVIHHSSFTFYCFYINPIETVSARPRRCRGS